MNRKVAGLLLALGVAACADPQVSTQSHQVGESCDPDRGINCDTGLKCVDDTCRLPCNSDKDCGKKQFCDNNFCKDNAKGECWTGWVGGSCEQCAENHYGPDCQACPDCGSHGTCDDTIKGSGQCKCDTGWTGTRCNECARGYIGPDCGPCQQCGDHGTCDAGSDGQPVCNCQEGWQGPARPVIAVKRAILAVIVSHVRTAGHTAPVMTVPREMANANALITGVVNSVSSVPRDITGKTVNHVRTAG